MKKNSKTNVSHTGDTGGKEPYVLLNDKTFRALVENNDAIIALLDKDLKALFRSTGSVRLIGWEPGDMGANAALQLIHANDLEQVNAVFREAFENPGKTIPVSLRLQHKNGHYLWMEGSITNMLHDPDIQGIITNIRDITERKEAEEKVQRALRLYYFISQVNQMIVRTDDETTLYEQACKIAVDLGRFRMAWIGLIDDNTNGVIPVMHAGEEHGYLSSMPGISIADNDTGKGPTGTAIREGRYVICNDIEKETSMMPWRSAALERGYRSSICLPVKKFDKIIGAFSLYADTINFFNEEEVALLEELTGDIAFALENFEKESMRRKAEQAVVESERRYHILAETSPVGIFRTDEFGNTIYVNPCWCSISGLSKEEALGNGWFNAVHEDDRDLLRKNWNMATISGQLSRSEYRFVRPDGSIRWVIGEAVPEKDEMNRIVGYVGTTTDITEHKKREEEVASLYRENELVLNRINDAIISLDNEWRYTFLNDAALATHPDGKEGTLGRYMWDVHPEVKNTPFWAKYNEARDTGKVVYIEEYYEPMQTWFSGRVYPSADGLTIFYVDINERKKAQQVIERERMLSDSVINSLPGIFYLYNREGRFLRWNRNFETVSGYSSEEMQRVHPLEFFDDADKELLTQKIANTFLHGEDYVQADFLIKSKEKIPYYFTGKAIDYGGEPCLLGVGIDFTDRVKAQEKIKETTEQLRMLTAHLQHIREEERKRIGREIHDELGQQLTAIKMDVAWLEKKMPESEAVFKGKLKNMRELLDGSNQAIRRILSELRPGILDDYGLLEAIDWLGSQFTSNTGIPLEFVTAETRIHGHDTVLTCIFRVYQEALTNITRYSNATAVLSSLTVEDGFITVMIEDNGKGFEVDAVKKHKSFGILGMKERVHSLGGRFELFSEPGKGTKIIVQLPVDSTDINHNNAGAI